MPKKKNKYVEVKAYLQPDNDKELIASLMQIATKNNLSVSQVVAMSLRIGVPAIGSTFSALGDNVEISQIIPLHPKRKKK